MPARRTASFSYRGRGGKKWWPKKTRPRQPATNRPEVADHLFEDSSPSPPRLHPEPKPTRRLTLQPHLEGNIGDIKAARSLSAAFSAANAGNRRKYGSNGGGSSKSLAPSKASMLSRAVSQNTFQYDATTSSPSTQTSSSKQPPSWLIDVLAQPSEVDRSNRPAIATTASQSFATSRTPYTDPGLPIRGPSSSLPSLAQSSLPGFLGYPHAASSSSEVGPSTPASREARPAQGQQRFRVSNRQPPQSILRSNRDQTSNGIMTEEEAIDWACSELHRPSRAVCFDLPDFLSDVPAGTTRTISSPPPADAMEGLYRSPGRASAEWRRGYEVEDQDDLLARKWASEIVASQGNDVDDQGLLLQPPKQDDIAPQRMSRPATSTRGKTPVVERDWIYRATTEEEQPEYPDEEEIVQPDVAGNFGKIYH